MAITDAWLKANDGKKRSARDERGDRDGLGVRVTPKGKLIFQMRYRYHGAPRRVDLGSYPLMSLKAARAENQRLRAQLEQGHDPKVVRLLEKQAIQRADSLEALFKHWYDAFCLKAKKNAKEIRRSFEIYVFPRLGKLPAEKITLHEWLALLEELVPKRPGITERILINAKQMLKWGIKRRLIPASPLAGINARQDLQIVQKVGKRSLSDAEIRLVWQAAEQCRMLAKNKLLLRLCLIYGCRNGELRLAQKEHFDFKKMVWTVPPENHKQGKKTGKPLLRPITPETEPFIRQAVALCGEGKYPFSGRDMNVPMSNGAQISLPTRIQQWLKHHKDHTMKHWSMHDLRKTARTNFSTLTEPHIAEIMLGHKLPGSWQVYDHYDYLPEQSAAYSAWCKRLATLTGDTVFQSRT